MRVLPRGGTLLLVLTCLGCAVVTDQEEAGGGMSAASPVAPALQAGAGRESATAEGILSTADVGELAQAALLLGASGAPVAEVRGYSPHKESAWAYVPSARLNAGVRMRDGSWTCPRAPFEVYYRSEDCTGPAYAEQGDAAVYAGCHELSGERRRPALFALRAEGNVAKVQTRSFREPRGGPCRKKPVMLTRAVRMEPLQLPALSRPASLQRLAGTGGSSRKP